MCAIFEDTLCVSNVRSKEVIRPVEQRPGWVEHNLNKISEFMKQLEKYKLKRICFNIPHTVASIAVGPIL